MKLKGHTKIELTDVNTGEKEVHEDDNMITNALKKMFGFNGMVGYDMTAALHYSINDKYSEIVRLTGGLLLFEDGLEENVDNIRPGVGTKLVGCGSGISYTGNNLNAGSYNKTESGPTDDGGYRHVWDFATNQANGQISCACLTTRSGGKITTGTDYSQSDYSYGSGERADIKEEITFRQYHSILPYYYSGSDSNSSDINVYSLLYVDGRTNRLIRAASDYWRYLWYTSDSDKEIFKKSIFYNKAIDLNIYRYGCTNFSISDTLNKSGDTSDYNDGMIETVHVDMPSELKSLITDDMINNTYKGFAVSISNDENYIYISIVLPTDKASNLYINANANIHVWKINVETFASSYIKVTNTTGEKIKFVSDQRTAISKMQYVFDNYFFCVGYETNQAYIIDLNDNTKIKTIAWIRGETELKLTISSYNDIAIYYERGRLVYVQGTGGSRNFVRVIDPVLGRVFSKNIEDDIYATNMGTNTLKLWTKVHGTPFFINADSQSSYRARAYGSFDPAILITINNLSSPVTKTASQTMKVTYTLTKA